MPSSDKNFKDGVASPKQDESLSAVRRLMPSKSVTDLQASTYSSQASQPGASDASSSNVRKNAESMLTRATGGVGGAGYGSVGGDDKQSTSSASATNNTLPRNSASPVSRDRKKSKTSSPVPDDVDVWVFILVVFRRVHYEDDDDGEEEDAEEESNWDCSAEFSCRSLTASNNAARENFREFCDIADEDDLETKACTERYNEQGQFRARRLLPLTRGRIEELLYQVQASEVYGLDDTVTELPESHKTLYVMYNEIQAPSKYRDDGDGGGSNVAMGVFATKEWANDVAENFFKKLPGRGMEYRSYQERMFTGEKALLNSKGDPVVNKVFVQELLLMQ